MQNQWQGKNALVTGAGDEIGRATVLMLASYGARVAVTAPVFEEARRIAAAVGDAGGEAIALPTDPTDVNQLRQMTQSAAKTFGPIDILVNNAPGNLHSAESGGKFTESEPTQWVSRLDALLLGTIATIRDVLPSMVERQTGRIVNLVSVAGISGLQGAPIRSAAEGGIIALCRTLAMDYGAYNICVNTIATGAIRSESDPDSVIGGSVFGRTGTPEEVAKLVCFLCSEEAGYITGQSYIIDGGCILGPKEE